MQKKPKPPKLPAKTKAQLRAERMASMEKQFAAIYISNGRNATRAYMGIFPTCSEVSAQVKGSQWLGKVMVQDEIERLTTEALKRHHMSAEEALALTAEIARLNPQEYYWAPGELDKDGQPTQAGSRKHLHDLTPDQARRIAGFRRTAFGTEMQFRDADRNLAFILKTHKLLSDKFDVTISTPLDKLIEQSYNTEADT